MAKQDGLDPAEKAKLLRAFAFQVHRKRSLDEVVMEYVEEELQRGRRKEFRPAAEAMNEHGAAVALKVLGLIGDEASAILEVLVKGKDHRQLSDVLESLAALQEE